MPRHIAALLACAAVLAPPALAQDRPISVYFRPGNVQQLNDAITAALSQPPFLLATTVKAGTLVVSIPDRVESEHSPKKGYTWSFDVAFMRDGDSKGSSTESCNEHQMSDCTDQLLSDIRTAAGAPQ